MAGLRDNDLAMLQIGAQGGNQAFVAGAESARNKANNDAKLAELIKGKQMDAQNYAAKGDVDLATLQKLNDSGLVESGGSAKAGELSTGADPYAHMQAKGAQQGAAFNKLVEGTYKPINEQLNASRSTLDALNQNNPVSDKLALISEGRLAAGSAGSRAIGQMVDVLSGGKTANQEYQDKLNWLQNTPDQVTLQPGQRNAIRESVFARMPQLTQQHQQAAAQLGSLGPATAPQADYGSILKAHTTPADANLQQIGQYQQDYMKARGPAGPISNPSVATPNPSNLDRLKSFLLGSGQSGASPQAQPPAPVQPVTAGTNAFDPTAYLGGK